MSTNTLKMWIVAGGVAFVLAVVLVFVQWQGSGDIVYADADPSLACLHGDQCERPADAKPIAEFQNTLSNLAYLLFGVCVIVRAGRDGVPMHTRPAMLLFGISLCFLALMSGYYHAALNFEGTENAGGGPRGTLDAGGALQCTAAAGGNALPQLLDMVGVYASVIALFLFGVEGVFKKTLARANAATWIFGLALPLATAIVFPLLAGRHAFGGPAAGLVLLLLLGILSMFALARIGAAAGPNARAWAVWLIWLLVLVPTAFIAYFIKSDFRWDSTMVFGAMMVLLIAALGTNWSLSPNPPPWPELAVLGVAFLLGIVPRLLDGYADSAPFGRKPLCAPDGPLQAHAVWHVVSAFALVLTYDLLEKSRALRADDAPATVLLPHDDALNAAMQRPLGQQPPSAILVKIAVSTASLLLLIVVLLRPSGGALGFWCRVFAALAVALSALLWLWPVWRKR